MNQNSPKQITMKKIYAMIIGVFAVAAVSAQCNVTFTYTVNGLTINATATGTGTAAFPAYGWEWGDSQMTINQQTATYTYATAGTYNVCVTFIDVFDTASCNAQSCQQVTVGSTGVQTVNAGVNSISASPSPFGESTTFFVNTTTNSDVKINVYDVTGKKVETVKDEMMPAGQHEIVWTPENLSEGVYFVQMEIEGQVYTKKIVHTSNQ